MNIIAPRSPERLVDIDTARGSFRVHRAAYKSPEVFEREKEMIFRKCWLYLGHETELSKPGDFVTRTVGGMDLIFARGKDGKLGAYFNNCPHRGAKFCRERKGTARNFTCPYHGWVFNTSGKLLSMATNHGYVDDLNADGHLDLGRPARLEDYRGFYFVNYNPNAISLYDYLADARAAIDNVCDQSEAGLTILPGEHSYTIRANYKLLCENSYDSYHLPTVHATYLEYLTELAEAHPDAKQVIDNTSKDFFSRGRTRGLGMGHGILESFLPTGRPVAQWAPSFGVALKPEIEAKRKWLEGKFGPERAEYIAEFQKNLVIFPNLVINDILSATVRYIEPEGPDHMRVTAWCIGPKDEHEALRAIRLDNFISFLGPAGFGSPDDIEMLELCQTGNAHSLLEWSEISKGAKDNNDLLHSIGIQDDERHMQAYWTMWDRVMRGIETLEA